MATTEGPVLLEVRHEADCAASYWDGRADARAGSGRAPGCAAIILDGVHIATGTVTRAWPAWGGYFYAIRFQHRGWWWSGRSRGPGETFSAKRTADRSTPWPTITALGERTADGRTPVARLSCGHAPPTDLSDQQVAAGDGLGTPVCCDACGCDTRWTGHL